MQGSPWAGLSSSPPLEDRGGGGGGVQDTGLSWVIFQGAWVSSNTFLPEEEDDSLGAPGKLSDNCCTCFRKLKSM